MTYNPTDLLAVRSYLLARLDLIPGIARGADLEPGEVGIMGDSAHAASGGYHVGNDDLARVSRLHSDYSKSESARDRPGSNAASALDIGDFDATVGGRRHTLRSLSLAIVDACRRGDPRTRDVREVIYTPDGTTVRRWDRLGIRTGGDDSHLWHTHISFFRDSEGRRHLADNILGLFREIIEGTDSMAQLTDAQLKNLLHTIDVVGAAAEGRTRTWDNKPIKFMEDLAQLTARPAPGTVVVTDEQLERVLRRVMGSVDGSSPAV